jgi:hypothetical protein
MNTTMEHAPAPALPGVDGAARQGFHAAAEELAACSAYDFEKVHQQFVNAKARFKSALLNMGSAPLDQECALLNDALNAGRKAYHASRNTDRAGNIGWMFEGYLELVDAAGKRLLELRSREATETKISLYAVTWLHVESRAVHAGQTFDAPETVAGDLLARGLALTPETVRTSQWEVVVISPFLLRGEHQEEGLILHLEPAFATEMLAQGRVRDLRSGPGRAALARREARLLEEAAG